jgi:hypothetical protein
LKKTDVPPPFDIEEVFQAPEEPQFRYNAVHDVESAWWVGVWMMFFFKSLHH